MNLTSSISALARKVAAAAGATALATLSLAGLGPAQPAGAATVAFDLCATTGTASFQNGTASTTAVSFWGYTQADEGACNGATVDKPGGPVLEVNEGASVTIRLHNNLVSEDTSLDIGGASLRSDVIGASGKAAAADALTTANTTEYAFTASRAGTFIYQAGLTANGPQEVALGLYGALVVRPATANQAYSDAGSAYDVESVLVLSELDPALTPANYAGFDMRNFAPKWGLLNGRPFSTVTGAPLIPAAADDDVLLRYVNAGSLYHSMSVLGANQTQLATDGHRLPADRHFVAETFGPGQTADVLVHVPAAAASGTKLTLFEGSTSLFNRDKKTNLATAKAFGGMMAFITVATSTGTPGGPFTNSMAFTGGVLTAVIDDTSTGGDNVAAAEYFVDTVGANGSGTALDAVDATFNDAVTEPVTSTTPLALSVGAHTLYVHGRDSAGNWGPLAALVVTVTAADTTGPATSAATATPAVTNHTPATVTVAVHATADDTATGGGAIAGGELFIDTAGANGSGVAMTASVAAPVASIDGTIDNPTLAGLPEGTHQVLIHARDATGNWGPTSAVTLVIDRTGPSTTGMTVSPNPNNGTVPVNTSTAAVRVGGIASDVAANNSTIVAAELFLCTALDTVSGAGCQPGATGTGVPMLVSDGAWDEPAESVYGDIPLTTVNTLTSGNHTIWVRGKDAAGNWGPAEPAILTIEKTAPTFTGIAVAPTQILVPPGTTVALTVNGASDGVNGAGVVGGEYWFGTTDIPAGTGTSFTGLAPTVNVSALPAGANTIRVRIRDAAGNWSTGTGGVATATITVVPDAIFANGFETGGRPWGWTSASTNTAARLNVTTTSPLVGARGLQAQGNNTNYVQYNYGTGANPAWATFDGAFSFNPNSNTSAGKDIMVAASNTNFSSANTVFRVRYRNNAGQLQVQVQRDNTANASWVNITNATHRIEVTWEAGTLTLYVDGVSSQTVTAPAANITAVRLGSVTNAGNAALMYFDAFSAKRSTSTLIPFP